MATLLNANNDDHNRNLRQRRYAIYPSLWCVYSFPSMKFSQQFIEFALQNFTCRLAKAGWSAQALTQISKSNCSYLFFLWNNIYKDSQSPKFDSNARVGVDDLAERKVGSCLTDPYYSSTLKVAEISTLGDCRVATFLHGNDVTERPDEKLLFSYRQIQCCYEYFSRNIVRRRWVVVVQDRLWIYPAQTWSRTPEILFRIRRQQTVLVPQ